MTKACVVKQANVLPKGEISREQILTNRLTQGGWEKASNKKEKGHSGDKDGSGKSSTHKHHQEKRKEGRD